MADKGRLIKKNLFGKAPKTDALDKKAPIVDSLPQKNDDGISDNGKIMVADNSRKKTENMVT